MKLKSQLYLLDLPLRRAALYILTTRVSWPTMQTFLNFIEVVCVLIPNLTFVALSLAEAVCHSIKAGLYVELAMMRAMQEKIRASHLLLVGYNESSIGDT